MIAWLKMFTLVDAATQQPIDPKEFSHPEYRRLDDVNVKMPDGSVVPCARYEQRCSWCGGEAQPQLCPGDGRVHHHGAMHEPNGTPHSEWWHGGYKVSCDACYPKAVAEWAAYRRNANA